MTPGTLGDTLGAPTALFALAFDWESPLCSRLLCKLLCNWRRKRQQEGAVLWLRLPVGGGRTEGPRRMAEEPAGGSGWHVCDSRLPQLCCSRTDRQAAGELGGICAWFGCRPSRSLLAPQPPHPWPPSRRAAGWIPETWRKASFAVVLVTCF